MGERQASSANEGCVSDSEDAPSSLIMGEWTRALLAGSRSTEPAVCTFWGLQGILRGRRSLFVPLCSSRPSKSINGRVHGLSTKGKDPDVSSRASNTRIKTIHFNLNRASLNMLNSSHAG
jgi:hypothetical protein